MNRIFAFVLLAFGFAGASHAAYIPATWTDSIDIGSGVYIGDGASYRYTHNLNDNGFRPLEDLISSFYLSIDLADAGTLGDQLKAAIDIPTLPIFDGGDEIVYEFGLVGEEYGGWSIAGLFQLNLLGTLTVTIDSLRGDFNLVGSTLTAQGLSNNVANVPEPGALGLLGIGLLGIALSKRRRKQAA